MKETVKVNLGGQLFNLDVDAYEKLKKYLDSLKRKFSGSPKEAEEIVEDIESRIAELLTAKIGDKKEVINLADVEEIIAQLGTADEMDEPEEEEAEQDSSFKSRAQSRRKKRFYRDVDNSVLGGVGSGLGAYFDIDPIWIRLLFVVLFFANLAGLLIYIILWIVIPPARTTAQKLEMQGKPVNISNIEKNVKEEFDKVTNNIKNIPNTKGYKNFESGLSEFFRVLGQILLVMLKVVGIIIGVGLLLAFVFAIIGFIAGGAIFFPTGWFDGWNWHWPHYGFWTHWTLAGICLFLVIFLPIFALLVKIVKLIFGIKTQNQVAAGLGATVWVLALITFIVILVTDIERGTFRKVDHSEFYFDVSNNKPLYIGVDLKDNSNHQLEYYHFFDKEFVWDEWNDDYLSNPKVVLRRSNDDKVKVEVYKNYLHFHVGKNPSRWRQLADYDWKFSDSRLTLDEYYSVDEDYIWRFPRVKVIITVPEAVEVICDRDVRNILDLNCNVASAEEFETDEDFEEAFEEMQESEDKLKLLEELEDTLQ